MKNGNGTSVGASPDQSGPAGAFPLAAGSPLCLQVQIGTSDDRELQTLTALAGVMEHFYPHKERGISDAFEMWRIAEYFHARYGIKPEHIQN